MKCIVKIIEYYRTHRCAWLNHRCKFVLYKAWIAEWWKNIFENMTTWGYVISAIEAKISEESITFYIEEWWIIQNGPRQQIATIFDNNKNTYGDEKTIRRTFRMAFCNWNNAKKDIGCWISVAAMHKDMHDYCKSCDACQKKED